MIARLPERKGRKGGMIMRRGRAKELPSGLDLGGLPLEGLDLSGLPLKGWGNLPLEGWGNIN